MHLPNDKFSIAIEGDDCDLLSIFFSDAFRHFRSATFYDRTDAGITARKNEMRLGRSVFASPEFRQIASKIQRDLANPAATNITVRFLKNGMRSQNVMVIDKQSSRILTFDLAHVRGFGQMNLYAREIIRAIEQAH